MERRLSEPPPEAAQNFDEILGRLGEDVLPFASVTGHSRYFSLVPGCPTWPASLGDLIASVSNIEDSSWPESRQADMPIFAPLPAPSLELVA